MPNWWSRPDLSQSAPHRADQSSPSLPGGWQPHRTLRRDHSGTTDPCHDRLVLEFVTVRRGWFLMGSDEGQETERPIHRVCVDAFQMAVYPVTRSDYALFLEVTGYEQPREWDNPAFEHPALPVVGVNWHDAQHYCAWRSRRDRPVRLPTEAEWELAARGGRDGQRYPWGDEIPDWVPNRGNGPLGGPWPVTLGEPNGYGLYGITANIHEWCANWHARDFYSTSPAINPVGPLEGRRRASRGGAWRHALTINRTAARSSLDPSFRYTDYGFRLARSLSVRGEPASSDP